MGGIGTSQIEAVLSQQLNGQSAGMQRAGRVRTVMVRHLTAVAPKNIG